MKKQFIVEQTIKLIITGKIFIENEKLSKVTAKSTYEYEGSTINCTFDTYEAKAFERIKNIL